MVFPPSWRAAAALCALLTCPPACEKKPEAKPKPPKKEAVAAQVSQERQALNTISRLLRELAAAPPDPALTPSARAAAMLSKLRTVPAATLPEALRAPWQEMTAVLEAAAQSTVPLPAPLRQRGEAAATALNSALAAEGLTDFRF